MKQGRYNLYWGELHTHTFCGNATFGAIEEAAAIARTHLDFWAAGEHYNLWEAPHPLFDWRRISGVIRESNDPGRFVTFPALEWAKEPGDYNIYLPHDLQELPEIQSYPALFAFARKEKGIAIPHHIGYKVGGRGMQWQWFDPALMPLVEIFSMHGSSEDERGALPMDLPWMGPRETGGTALSGLLQGHVFGFIASSDGHNAYPGAYKMGLAAAYATELTRESLWEAFLARRTYAVTGDRILVDFQMDGHPMGSVYASRGERSLAIDIEGLDALDKIEVIKNGRVLLRDWAALDRNYEHGKPGRCKVRLEWGWGPGELWRAEGALAVKGGDILAAAPCFGPPGPNEILSRTPESVRWTSRTEGRTIFDWRTGRYAREGTNSIVFTIQGSDETMLELHINDRLFQHSLAELMAGSRVELMDGAMGQKVKFHEPIPQEQYRKVIQVTDRSSESRTYDFYYVRVTQANGQMAWSSPIWVEAR